MNALQAGVEQGFRPASTCATEVLRRRWFPHVSLAAACVLAAVSSGCIVVSLHPAYEDSSIQYDEGLIGSWKSEDEDTTVRFEPGEWRSYRVTLTTQKSTATLSGHLTRIGSMDVLDLMPATGIDLATLSIAVHVIVRIHRDGDALTASAMDYETARRAVPRPFGIQGVMDERQNVVLSAPTADLRRVLSERGPGTEIFGAASTLRRVQAG